MVPGGHHKGETMKRKQPKMFSMFNWDMVTFSPWQRMRLYFSPMQVFEDKNEGIVFKYKTTKAGKIYIYSISHTVGRGKK
jgi:hypothetical protein